MIISMSPVKPKAVYHMIVVNASYTVSALDLIVLRRVKLTLLHILPTAQP